jgi:hypothetical protein
MDDFSRVLGGIENWFDEANRVAEEIERIQFSIENYCFYTREGIFSQDDQEEITSSIGAVGSQIERLKQTRKQSLGVLHFKSFAKIGFFIQGHKRWKYAIDVMEASHWETKKKWPKVVSYLNKKVGIAESSEMAPSWAPDDFEIQFFADTIGNGFSIPPGIWFGVGRDAYSNVTERLMAELNQVIAELNAGGYTQHLDSPGVDESPETEIELPKPAGDETLISENHTQNPQNTDGPFRVELDEDSRVLYFGTETFDRLTERIVSFLRVFVENWNDGNKVMKVGEINKRAKQNTTSGFLEDAFKVNRKNETIHRVSTIIEQVSDGYYRFCDPRKAKN